MLEGLQFRFGEWCEEYRAGRAVCVFRAAAPIEGAIVAKGLYVATDGEVIVGDYDQAEVEIGRRTVIEANMGNLTIQAEFADVLALLPELVADVSKDLRRSLKRRCRQCA